MSFRFLCRPFLAVDNDDFLPVTTDLGRPSTSRFYPIHDGPPLLHIRNPHAASMAEPLRRKRIRSRDPDGVPVCRGHTAQSRAGRSSPVRWGTAFADIRDRTNCGHHSKLHGRFFAHSHWPCSPSTGHQLDEPKGFSGGLGTAINNVVFCLAKSLSFFFIACPK